MLMYLRNIKTMVQTKHYVDIPSYYHRGEILTEDQGVRLKKPVSIRELKYWASKVTSFEICLGNPEFRRTGFDQNAYFKEFVEAFDIEELYIFDAERLTELPESLWNKKLNRIQISRGSSKNNPIIIPPFESDTLEAITVNAKSVKFDKSVWKLPNLKFVHILGLDEDIIEFNPKIENINISDSDNTLSFDLEKYSSLYGLQLTNTYLAQPNINLEKLPNLEGIVLQKSNCNPINWGSASKLYSISIEDRQHEQPLVINFDSLPELKRISISDKIDETKPFLGKLPNVEYLVITNLGTSVSLSEEVFISPHLNSVSLKNVILPKKINLEHTVKSLFLKDTHVDNCDSFLKHFAEIFFLRVTYKNTDWSTFSNLVELSLTDILVDELPNFGKENTRLWSISLSNGTKQYELPYSWHLCPNLTKISFHNLDATIPHWEIFDSLKAFSISGKSKSFLPKETLTWKNFFQCDAIRAEENQSLKNDIHIITSDSTLSNESKLILGAFLFETEEEAKKIDNFEINFLGLLSCNSSSFRHFVSQKAFTLNNHFQRVNLEELVGKTVGILGKPQNNKTYYKEKLESLGAKFVNKIDEKTEYIITCEFPEIPANFFNHKHYYFSEEELETLLKDFEPGYIQTLDNEELHNLRELIWSDEVENDKLVVEMIKGGGIAEALIPDLIILAKSTQDDGVKNALKKLLKGRVDVGGQKILGDKTNLRRKTRHNPIVAYMNFNSNLDLSQMAFTFAKRFNRSFFVFFQSNGSMTNQYRKEAFELAYSEFWVKPIQLSLYFPLYGDEINFLLNKPEFLGKLKILVLTTDDLEEVMDSILLHASTLKELTIKTSCHIIPEGLGKLLKLNNLTIHGDKITTLPNDFLKLKKLKDTFINGNDKMEIDNTLKAFIEDKNIRFNGSVSYI